MERHRAAALALASAFLVACGSGEPELGKIVVGAKAKSGDGASPRAPASTAATEPAAARPVPGDAPSKLEAVALLERIVARVEAGDDKAAAAMMFFAPGTDEDYKTGFVASHFAMIDRRAALEALKEAKRWGSTPEVAPGEVAVIEGKRRADPGRCYTLAGGGYRAHFIKLASGLKLVSWSGPAPR
jgi:hypothetical protein